MPRSAAVERAAAAPLGSNSSAGGSEKHSEMAVGAAAAGAGLTAVGSHLSLARQWAADASRRAGVPPPLQLLPSVPVELSPAWRRAPSFAAAAALLVPLPADSSAGRGGSSSSKQEDNQQQPQPAASAAELAAAEAIARAAGLRGRAIWAAGGRGAFFVYATPYEHVRGVQHRQAQLLPLTLQHVGLLPRQPGQQATQQQVQEVRDQQARWQQAAALFQEIAADQQPGGLRLLGYLLSNLFRWLFSSEVYVDTAALQRLRVLYEQRGSGSDGGGGGSSQAAPLAALHPGQPAAGPGPPPRASLVFIPAHKSHLDYLMLSYILFASGLPCPHIAAGANLRLPLVGRLLRACGAFFIRRTSRGAPDAHLYKAVLAGYVHALLQEGHCLEFFIEGGRSRDGRVNPPKLGMLKMVVDAVAAGDVQRPVYLVPTAMNYDAVPEERSLAAQLAGAPKQSESLAGLARTCWSIVAKALRCRFLGLGAGGYCGRATVAFGQPILLQQWLQEQEQQLAAGGAAQRAAVAALGEQVTAGIRAASAVPSSALLLGVLHAERHAERLGCAAAKPAAHCNGSAATGGGERSGMAAADAAAGMDCLAAELQRRGAAVVRVPPGAPDAGGKQEQLVLHLASMLRRCCSAVGAAAPPPRRNGGAGSGGAQRQQQPALVLESGVEAALLQHSRLNQLLPWLGGEGLLVAALLAAAGRQGAPGVSAAEVLDSAAWLRCVLAPEIDTALGPAALGSMPEFEAALEQLVTAGALQRLAQPLHCVALAAEDSEARRGALLGAALLAPLLATYLEAARAMQAALAGGVPASSKALCSAAQQRLLAAARGGAAPLVVPSVALAQGALRSLAALGVLAPAPQQASPQEAPPPLQQVQQQAWRAGGSEAAAVAPGADTAEDGGAPGVELSASSSDLDAGGEGSAGGSTSFGHGAVDEEYAAGGATTDAPPPPRPAGAAGEGGSGGALAGGAGPRGSLERRRQRQQRRAERGSPGSSRSGSGSDSEADPAADSVAAGLCSLGSPSLAASPAASPAASAPASATAADTAAAAAAAAAADGHHRWVLGQSEAVMQQLLERLEAALAAFQ